MCKTRKRIEVKENQKKFLRLKNVATSGSFLCWYIFDLKKLFFRYIGILVTT
jgi:hypothetical protein